jgi:hypothetical protein
VFGRWPVYPRDPWFSSGFKNVSESENHRFCFSGKSQNQRVVGFGYFNLNLKELMVLLKTGKEPAVL